ncbi:MAG: DUF6265 family protein [Agriterribacter sp.]
MRKAVFIAFLWISSAVSAQQQDAATTFGWLKGGEWQMATKKGIIIEKWQDTANGNLAGKVYFLSNNGVKKPMETVLISCNNNCWYIPIAARQNEGKPVRFKITTNTGQSFVAENQEHDFPKRITYELISMDSIHAWVDDGAVNPQKRNDYYYSRKKQ